MTVAGRQSTRHTLIAGRRARQTDRICATDICRFIFAAGAEGDGSVLGGGQRDGGWQGEGRPAGGHALAIVAGMTHYDMVMSPALAAAALSFLDAART